ncbi:hypothetical protein JXA88_06850 [Candidatus Fermentibacteria bacterium]|nr:hypothetical protein [Candidatus Fermentibacteria bacterium]
MKERAGSDPLIAAYVSGHGFGHAVRTSTILKELLKEMPKLRVIAKTDAPAWLFAGLGDRVCVLPVQVDAPPVQADAFTMDIDATLAGMQAWLSRKDEWIRREAAWLEDQGVALVIADISPLALAAADLARVPSALIANFTWEWILSEAYLPHPLSAAVAREWSACTPLASWCFCTAPTAEIGHPCPIPVGIVGRRCEWDRDEVRQWLGLSASDIAVLLSFGGLDIRHVDFGPLAGLDVVYLSTSPKSGLPRCQCVGREVDHACLMHAADVVVGKLGYSTVAEAVIHGTPFLFAPRANWPEEQILRTAVEGLLPWACVPWDRFAAGQWAHDLLTLAGRGKTDGQIGYGGAQVARLVAAALRNDALDRPDLYPPASELASWRSQAIAGLG